MGSLIGQRIDYSGVGVLRGQWDIPNKKMTKANLPFPPSLPRTYKQEGAIHSLQIFEKFTMIVGNNKEALSG